MNSKAVEQRSESNVLILGFGYDSLGEKADLEYANSFLKFDDSGLT